MDYDRKPALYILTHTPTGVFYVGSTGDLRHRLIKHLHALKWGKHRSRLLQQKFTSWEDIHVEFRYMDSKEIALDFEQNMLNLVHGLPGCANASKCARNNYEFFSSPESRKKSGLTRRGRRLSKEVIEKQSAGRSKQVSIDGVEYPSVKAAAEALGVTPGAITQGLKHGTKRHESWRYL